MPELLPAHGYAPPSWTPPPPPPHRPRRVLALALFVLTFLCTTTLGPVFWAMTRTDVLTPHEPFLTPMLAAAVWSDPELLRLGLSFSVPALLILLAHEMGHYLACRRYRLPATLPYFIPLPAMLGTLGAFIRIRAPLRDRRELFDVGVAGPIAGFVMLIPFLIYGAARSEPALLQLRPGEIIFLPGQCLAVDLAARVFHGPLADGMVLNLHPFALAAWFGLLATSINLIPLGQLDGGHILYAVSRRWQRRLAPLVWLGLAAAGFLWPGWWVWCVLSLVFSVFHPRLQSETAPLSRGRKLVAAFALVILILSFMPRGLSQVGAFEEPESTGEWVGVPGTAGILPAPGFFREEKAAGRMPAVPGEEPQKSAMKVTGPSLTSDTSM